MGNGGRAGARPSRWLTYDQVQAAFSLQHDFVEFRFHAATDLVIQLVVGLAWNPHTKKWYNMRVLKP